MEHFLPDNPASITFPYNSSGFNLVELLMALALLGLTATLSIPMVLTPTKATTLNNESGKPLLWFPSHNRLRVDFGANSATTFAH